MQGARGRIYPGSGALHKRRRFSRFAAALPGLFLCTQTACCPDRETGLILRTSDTVAAGGFKSYAVASPRMNANVEAVLTWPDSGVTLDLAFTGPDCGGPRVATAGSPCAILGSPLGSRPGRKELTANAGRYKAFVLGDASRAQTFDLAVTWDTGPCT